MNIRVKLLREGACAPMRAHSTDAGADLFAWSEFTIPSQRSPRPITTPYEPLKYPVGIAIELPPGHFGLVQSKSSVAALGIDTIANVIDEEYRGEIHVVFANLSMLPIFMKKGPQIAQLLVLPYADVSYSLEEGELSSTARGTGGFGSTGQFQGQRP